MKRRVLCVTDYCCTTGFGTVAHNLLARVPKDDWEIHVCAINHHGDPHPLQRSVAAVYPAARAIGREDPFGVKRFPDLINAIKPDLVFIQMDAWNIPLYYERAAQLDVKVPPVVAYCPPDSPNQPAGADLTKHGVRHLLCPTQFGIDALEAGGWEGPSTLLPYGVDPIFQPLDRRQARRKLQFPDDLLDAFLIGRADRNAHRKRYDLTLEGFAEWWHGSDRPLDAHCYFHCSPKSPHGWDLVQLASYYGVTSQVHFSASDHFEGAGVPLSQMPLIYNSWDLHLAPCPEGFGLVGLESAACGVAQAVLNYSAYGEWLEGGAHFLPVTHRYATTGCGTIQASTSPTAIAEVIGQVYRNRTYRDRLGRAALAVATDPCYHWDTLAAQFVAVWQEVLGG